jgi:hypothetical protein
MPYKEKIAWLSLFAMGVTFIPYFVLVASGVLPQRAMPDLRQLALFGAVAVAQACILGMGHLLLRRGAPAEARMPADERDQAIQGRAVIAAYYVLIAGMIVVGCVMPFTASGWRIVNAALFMIIAAELVHYGVIAASYRRMAG